MSILRNFDNFADANDFESKLQKHGAETELYAKWNQKRREYVITVSAILK